MLAQDAIVTATTITAEPPQPTVLPDWRDLCSLPEAELAKHDIAAVHLACAVGLPSRFPLDIRKHLEQLDGWAELVSETTDRLSVHFRSNPDVFRNSWAYFRTLVLVTVLQRDLGVHGTAVNNDWPNFVDAADWFLHGVLAGDPGNCATLPIVVAAVGRRLGYPIVTVRAPSHLFCRWDEPGERFNIECSGVGLLTPDDEYYLRWPCPITRESADHAGYLVSLPPRAELSGFLLMRQACLQHNRRYGEALEAVAVARKLHPENGLMLNTIDLLLNAWQRDVWRRLPRKRPQLEIGNPPLRYPELPNAARDKIVYLEGWEAYLNRFRPRVVGPVVQIVRGKPGRVIVSYS